jgi:hypothetical protein
MKYDPITLCASGTLTLTWSGLHGVAQVRPGCDSPPSVPPPQGGRRLGRLFPRCPCFSQIPSDSCPSTFDTVLAEPTNGGTFSYTVPQNEVRRLALAACAAPPPSPPSPRRYQSQPAPDPAELSGLSGGQPLQERVAHRGDWRLNAHPTFLGPAITLPWARQEAPPTDLHRSSRSRSLDPRPQASSSREKKFEKLSEASHILC